MKVLLFPDNTVLVNFALLKEVALLERILAGRGSWVVTIESECARSATVPGLEQLHLIPAILGHALAPTGAERVDTALYRAKLARPGDSSTAHLGEAETCAVIVRRSIAARFITDDFPAVGLAQSLDIETYSTSDLLILAVKVGFISVTEGWEFLSRLATLDRAIPQAPRSFEEFKASCT